MFSATKFVVTTGVIVALLGGALLTGALTRPAAVPGAAPTDPGTFSPTGSLAQPRALHTATLLPDGRVLVVGGEVKGGRAIASGEIWDPDSGTFSPTGSLAEGRINHAAILLPDDRVLIAGGSSTGHGHRHVALAEVWDPATGTFSPAGSTAQQEALALATLLPDGRVLFGLEEEAASVEVWDPATNTFSPGSTIARSHPDHLAALGEHPLIEEIEVTGPPVDPERGYSTRTALPDGRVLIVGGCHEEQCVTILASAEIWDPVTGMYSPTDSLAVPRFANTVTALPDGRVLVVGGWSPDDLASAEVWEPGDR